MLCTNIVLNVKTRTKNNFCTQHVLSLYFSGEFNEQSLVIITHCGLTDSKMRASDTDLPVIHSALNCILKKKLIWFWIFLSNHYWLSGNPHISLFRLLYLDISRRDNIEIRGVSGYQTLVGQVVMWCVVACRRRPAAPSILSKSGWAIAHPAHPPLTPLLRMILMNKFIFYGPRKIPAIKNRNINLRYKCNFWTH